MTPNFSNINITSSCKPCLMIVALVSDNYSTLDNNLVYISCSPSWVSLWFWCACPRTSFCTPATSVSNSCHPCHPNPLDILMRDRILLNPFHTMKFCYFVLQLLKDGQIENVNKSWKAAARGGKFEWRKQRDGPSVFSTFGWNKCMVSMSTPAQELFW